MVWTYTRNANHWTKGIVSIDGLDKLGKAGRVHSIRLARLGRDSLRGNEARILQPDIVFVRANSLPSVRKIVARISQSVFVQLRPGLFSVRYFITSK